MIQNLERNTLSLHRTLAHIARLAVYTLVVHGWKLALAYRTWKDETILRIAKTLQIPQEKINNKTKRKLFNIIETLVGYAYYTKHGTLPPLSEEVGYMAAKTMRLELKEMLQQGTEKTIKGLELSTDKIGR